jgi:nucleoside-diphosphate-sugar epimerase
MILLTGATGFVGRVIARRLLDAGRSIIVLARARDGVAAGGRVASALGGPPWTFLEVVEGDLTAPGCGLTDAARARLRARVETVIHCAGDTSFFPAEPAAYHAGHIDGPVALLRALARGRLAVWAQMSTAYVCGERSGLVLESDGDRGQTFHNEYERVKLRAESALREAGAATGVDVRVMRPSIVVGSAPSTAGGIPSNLFFTFIRLLAALARWPSEPGVPLRLPGAPHAPFNIVPVDYVADAAIALAVHPTAARGTYHLVVRDAPSQATMLAMICERLGLSGPTLAAGARGPLTDPSPMELLVADMVAPYRAYLEQDVRFDDQAAAEALARCGIPRPRLGPPDVRRLVDLAVTGEGRVSAVALGDRR